MKSIRQKEIEISRAIEKYNIVCAVARDRCSWEIVEFNMGINMHCSLRYIEQRYLMALQSAQDSLQYNICEVG